MTVLTPHARRTYALFAVLAFFVLANIALWHAVRPIKARWMNVPPVPASETASFPALGDAAFAYRLYAIMIQNFGDTGGRTTALKEYDYEALGAWLRLQNLLDARSDFMPYLAAYVYGGSQDTQKLTPVIRYLELAAGDGAGEKWRWLAQAVHLARFKKKDMPLARELAEKLAAMSRPDMPGWTRQMPAFVANESGDKQAALGMMISMIESSIGKVPPQEVNAMMGYVCDRILTPAEAKTNALCQAPPVPVTSPPPAKTP